MNIDISMIAKSINQEMTTTAEITLDMFSSRLGDFPISRKAPVELHICNQENAAVLITGTVDIEVMIPCARCLEEVPTRIHFDIDKEFRLENSAINDEEMEDIDYLIGFDLDVDKLIYGEILVNWPMKVLCKEDCKGVCQFCGANLNEGQCSCKKSVDPRLEALKQLLDN